MRKFYALLLSFILCLSLSEPFFAASNPIDHEKLSEAYIDFSEYLADMDVSVSICLEDFISGYEWETDEMLEQYTDSLIKKEISIALIDNINVQANLDAAAEYNELEGINSEVQPYSVGGDWYDNIGTKSPKLSHVASYDKYNILSTVKKGDIIEETEGLVAQITGHIAIVQGKYWDSTYNQYYIRTIEAGIDGVVYGVLDDERYDERGVTVYYVMNATTSKINSAIAFCKVQIGKPYALDIPILTFCNYSADTDNWYCSELVWAAYYNQGINLNGDAIPLNIYMPERLADSTKLLRRRVI